MVSVVAVIPARGGSKGVPGKNLRRVGGVPLVVRAIDAARSSDTVDLVLVSTDSPQIGVLARTAGAGVIERPAELSGDLASSESALLHALDQLAEQPEVVVFIQATSPFIDPADLDDAVRRVRTGSEDVVFSAVETYDFLWRLGEAGAEGVNHDASLRPRRQDREAHYRETGAFYVMRADGFRAAGHRFFGRVGVAVVDHLSAVDVDTMSELELADALAPLIERGDEVAVDVDAVVTDFDGVHTDDRVLVGADGSEFVTTSREDGMGVSRLRRAGIPVLILSTETNPVVAARAKKLQVEVLHGVDDKAAALTRWADTRGIPLERIAYLGNDVNDLGCLRLVGWPVVVPGAAGEVTTAARLVLQKPGGHGAVRELAEKVLKARGRERMTEVEEPWLYPLAATQ